MLTSYYEKTSQKVLDMPSHDREPTKAIQVRFPESKKNELKAFAAARGITIQQLILNMFDIYKKQEERKEKA